MSKALIREHTYRCLYASMVPKYIRVTTNSCECGKVVKQNSDRQHRNSMWHTNWVRLHPVDDQQCLRDVDMRARMVAQRTAMSGLRRQMNSCLGAEPLR
jgi:hypothetical protein